MAPATALDVLPEPVGTFCTASPSSLMRAQFPIIRDNGPAARGTVPSGQRRARAARQRVSASAHSGTTTEKEAKKQDHSGDHEEDLGEVSRKTRYTAETQQRGNDGNNRKYDCPAKHEASP
ncbi:hypothetical protein FHS96_003398 [Sphingomonas zeicaulis]